MKKADQVRTLSALTKKVKVGERQVVIDSSILFNRLLLIAERSCDLESCFCYELTAMPASLFKDDALRKTDNQL